MNRIVKMAAAMVLAVGLTTGIVAAQQLQPGVSVEQPGTQDTDTREADGGAQEIVAQCKAERGEPGEADRGIGECVSEAVHERNEARQEEHAAEQASKADQPAQPAQAALHGHVEAQSSRH